MSRRAWVQASEVAFAAAAAGVETGVVATGVTAGMATCKAEALGWADLWSEQGPDKRVQRHERKCRESGNLLAETCTEAIKKTNVRRAV